MVQAQRLSCEKSAAGCLIPTSSLCVGFTPHASLPCFAGSFTSQINSMLNMVTPKTGRNSIREISICSVLSSYITCIKSDNPLQTFTPYITALWMNECVSHIQYTLHHPAVWKKYQSIRALTDCVKVSYTKLADSWIPRNWTDINTHTHTFIFNCTSLHSHCNNAATKLLQALLLYFSCELSSVCTFAHMHFIWNSVIVLSPKFQF